ncbi:MAG TPA: hypothetical protein VFB02_10740 [Bradyrhizobium sp.]|nr:hypothetical protein [Bradyrhizobium sp.]
MISLKRSIQKLMWRLQWTPDRAGVLWLLVSAIVAIGFFAAVMIRYPYIQQRNASAGFSADWDCTPQPKGEPICIKRIGR